VRIFSVRSDQTHRHGRPIVAKIPIGLNFFLKNMPMIDLHIHSTLSDGTLSPEEIISTAKKKGISALSITDHDTMAAYPEAIRCGRENEIEVLPGIEITTHHQDLSLHILGFGLQHDSIALTTGLRAIQEARHERNRQIMAKLKSFNLEVTMEDLPHGNGQTGRPHIAKVLVQKGIVRSEQEAFAKFLRKDGAAYVKRQLLPVSQAIAMITAAGGVAVLAHPGTLRLAESDFLILIRQLMAAGLAGIEVYHPMNSEKILHFLVKFCHNCRLITTGGSDFHGREADKAPLGETGGKRKIPDHLFPALVARLAEGKTSKRSQVSPSALPETSILAEYSS
jgi:predicted metal-dependent phosphoesterase TrpH